MARARRTQAMEIREPEGIEDLRGAMEAHHRAWRVGYRGIVPEEVIDAVTAEPDDEALEELRETLRTEAGAYLVAERDDRIAGYVRIRWGETKGFVGPVEAGLKELYVDPAHWRQGVGSALLGAGIDWTPSMVQGVALETLADNDRGRAFYESHGFAHEETFLREVAGEKLEHAIYRVGLEEGLEIGGVDDGEETEEA